MSRNDLLHKFAVLAGAIMVIAGIGLAIFALQQLPTLPGIKNSAVAARLEAPTSPLDEPASPLSAALTTNDSAQPTEQPTVPREPVVVAITDLLPAELLAATGHEQDASSVATDLPASANSNLIALPPDNPQVMVRLDWQENGGEPVYRQFFAAATRFDTIDLNLRMLNIERAWNGDTHRFKSIAVLSDTLPALNQLLGEAGESIVPYPSIDQLVNGVWASNDILALVPFDQLQPNLAVYAVDGQIPVENAVKFNASAYPLIATVYAHLRPGAPSSTITRLTALLPSTNRDPNKLTLVAMTGVTAMARLTAKAIDSHNPAWPADVVGPELASADITAISNEVPFVPGCETNADRENLTFCSKTQYMATLAASGADIVGLTGNHLNDFGPEDSLTSLEIYKKAGISVYGGGADKQSAMAPLFVEHNGNKLAFLGANSYGPPGDWATDNGPGSAPFDLAIMSAAIRSIKQTGDADVVFTELQYQESDGVSPLADQRLDFDALAHAGADIVTGVQSHVPQAMAFVDGHLILYGLGNLYFDQMWDEDSREGLIVKHTIYNGRHISTQIVPTLLFDYGQPRWPEPERRAAILAKVFGASNWQN